MIRLVRVPVMRHLQYGGMFERIRPIFIPLRAGDSPFIIASES
jgi:hypothetical protein